MARRTTAVDAGAPYIAVAVILGAAVQHSDAVPFFPGVKLADVTEHRGADARMSRERYFSLGGVRAHGRCWAHEVSVCVRPESEALTARTDGWRLFLVDDRLFGQARRESSFFQTAVRFLGADNYIW